jgi:hypothetical protein
MRKLGVGLVIVLSVMLLLGTLGLGFLASWGRVDPNLHSMGAFLAGVLAFGIHIRSGSGLDFLVTSSW